MNNKNDWLPCLIAITFLYGIFGILGIGCLIKFLSGASCLGCGMTRAWIAVIHFDIKKAYEYHPLFPLPLFWLIVFICRKRLNAKLVRILFYISIAMFFEVYIVRLIDKTDKVVTFNLQDGLIYKLLKSFLSS